MLHYSGRNTNYIQKPGRGIEFPSEWDLMFAPNVPPLARWTGAGHILPIPSQSGKIFEAPSIRTVFAISAISFVPQTT